MLSFNNNNNKRMWQPHWETKFKKKEKEPPPNNPWLYLSQQKIQGYPLSQTPGVMAARPQRCGKAASEKCHKQGEEVEGALVCL